MILSNKERTVRKMEENVKVNFLKKIWYSIARPNKYEVLKIIGVRKSNKIFFFYCMHFGFDFSINCYYFAT